MEKHPNVIEWFGNVIEKHRHCFISFDIADFYPSISENLRDEALSWASNLANITKDETSIIKHARKSLRFNDGKPWIKKTATVNLTYSWVVMMEPKFYHKLDYIKQAPQKARRNRQRNIIWFNPPFSKNVNTNIARNFLCLIHKHCPPNHKLHKIFNRNTVKVSYSWMSNVKSIILNTTHA